MCAALFGLMLVCSTMIFLFSSPFSSLTPSQNAARSKNAFKYPPPATSTLAIPSTLPKPFAISCAICRGAFFNRFANSKHTGEAASPISIFGGRSSTIASSTPYFSRMCPASASRNRFVSVWYTCPRLECGACCRFSGFSPLPPAIQKQSLSASILEPLSIESLSDPVKDSCAIGCTPEEWWEVKGRLFLSFPTAHNAVGYLHEDSY